MVSRGEGLRPPPRSQASQAHCVCGWWGLRGRPGCPHVGLATVTSQDHSLLLRLRQCLHCIENALLFVFLGKVQLEASLGALPRAVVGAGGR